MSEEAVVDQQKDKYVTFQSGHEFFGIKIQYVNEIIVFQEIVVDVRLRFGQEPIEYTDRTCIIVLNVNDMVVGLIVERIAEVVEITEENILPAPRIGKADKAHHIFVENIGKVGDTVKLLLDPDKLLNDEDYAVLEQINPETEEGE